MKRWWWQLFGFWNLLLMYWVCVMNLFVVVVSIVIAITLPPPCMFACHQIHPPSPSLLEITICLLFVVFLCSIPAWTRNNVWCKHSFYVWHLYLGCEYEPKIHHHSINSSIDQDSRNNGRRKCVQDGCSSDDDDNYCNIHNNNMRCQKFDDQDLHTLVTHQKEVLDNNAIWL